MEMHEKIRACTLRLGESEEAFGRRFGVTRATVQVPEVKTVSTGLRARPLSVWQAVGEDIRTAARKYEQTGS